MQLLYIWELSTTHQVSQRCLYSLRSQISHWYFVTLDDPPHWDFFPPILSSITDIPLIVNGGVWEREDISEIRKQTGIDGNCISEL